MSFKGYLRKETAVTIMLGPFLDTTDGNTYEGAMTLEDTEIWLSKNGAAFTNPNNTNNATVDASVGAYYSKALDTTDTGTLGLLRIVTKDTDALIVDDTYMVVDQNWYDAMVETDNLQVDIIQVGGDTQSLTDLKDFADTGYDPVTHQQNGLPALQADVTDILADTNELQGNQGNWLTATGFMPNTEDGSSFTALNDVTAAEVKTAMEATGSDLDYLIKALVNKAVWTEASGDLEMFNDADGSLGTIAAQVTTDGTYTTRKRTVK